MSTFCNIKSSIVHVTLMLKKFSKIFVSNKSQQIIYSNIGSLPNFLLLKIFEVRLKLLSIF